MSRAARLAAITAALLLCRPLAASDKPPDLSPWSLAVEVRWSGDAGPEAFRADVERSLATALGSSCVGSVKPGADADLVLIATLSGFVEELRFDDSLATAATPGEPTKELRRVATLEVDSGLQLLTRAQGREVATKSFHVEVNYRPMYLGEEPQATARTHVIERLVQETSRAMCKSGGKLAARVRKELDAR
jgi:hypothetical protein